MLAAEFINMKVYCSGNQEIIFIIDSSFKRSTQLEQANITNVKVKSRAQFVYADLLTPANSPTP